MFKAAENVEAIVLSKKSVILQTMRIDALSTMSSLKLLKFGYKNVGFQINFSGTLAKLSNELGYLSWIKYPFECLPPSFEPDKLVELRLPYSNIKQLWEGTKVVSIIIIIFLYYFHLNKQIKIQTSLCYFFFSLFN